MSEGNSTAGISGDKSYSLTCTIASSTPAIRIRKDRLTFIESPAFITIVSSTVSSSKPNPNVMRIVVPKRLSPSKVYSEKVLSFKSRSWVWVARMSWGSAKSVTKLNSISFTAVGRPLLTRSVRKRLESVPLSAVITIASIEVINSGRSPSPT